MLVRKRNTPVLALHLTLHSQIHLLLYVKCFILSLPPEPALNVMMQVCIIALITVCVPLEPTMTLNGMV